MKHGEKFLVLASIFLFASCNIRTESSASSKLRADENSAATADGSVTEQAEKEGYPTFAFYEGIPAQSERNKSRTDGTAFKMPCIGKDVIEAGVEKSYDFWHGHSGELHRFTLTVESLQQLKEGKSIEVYTVVVDGHKHAVQIDTKKTCKVK